MNDLPSEWIEARLDDCAQFNPKHPSDTDRTTEVSFVPMPAVREITGTIEAHDVRRLSDVWTGYTHFRTGDVIFAKITPCMENGKIAVARQLRNGLACGSTEFHVLRPHSDVSADYIWRFLRQKAFRRDAEQSMTGAVGQRRVPADFLRDTMLPLPPSAEQRRIVTKLDGLSVKSGRARDHIDLIPRLVEKYKQAILVAAFRGDLTSKWRKDNPHERWQSEELNQLAQLHETYLGARRGSRLGLQNIRDQQHHVPSTWANAHLAEAGTLQVGYAFKSAWYVTHGTRLLRGANVAPGIITWDDEKRVSADRAAEFREYQLNEGDIVIAMDRPVISTGLKVAVVERQDAGCLLVQRVGRYVAGEFVDGRFVWHLINSHIFIDHAVSMATGSDLPHISSNDILTTPLPLPPRREQQEISHRIDAALTWINRLTAEATSARKLIDHLDQAVLAKAFRGELVPQDPNDEPASLDFHGSESP
jgi:type I restriction enzyme S subunit